MTRTATQCDNPLCSCDPCHCTDCKCGAAKLGTLERRVMECIWQSPSAEVTVREVTDGLPEYAYTTTATVLDRLVVKGLLRCRLVDRTKRYTAIGSQGAHTAVLMYESLSADRNPDAALARFAQSLSDEEARVLHHALDAASTSNPN